VSENLADSDADRRLHSRLAEQVRVDHGSDDEKALADALTSGPVPPRKATEVEQSAPPKKRKPDDDPLSDGVMAALSKLRKS
jgi:DNA excision repair protein ERCC-1